MSEIVVNSNRVNEIANELESQNKKLKNELSDTASLIANLGKSWDSTAYRETNAAFQKFAEEFSNNYEKIISNYVSFLREQVSRGYIETEKANIDLASAFK